MVYPQALFFAIPKFHHSIRRRHSVTFVAGDRCVSHRQCNESVSAVRMLEAAGLPGRKVLS